MPGTIHILLVETDPDDIARLRQLLDEEEFDIQVVESLDAVDEVINANDAVVVGLDNGCKRYDLIERIADQNPVVIITSADHKDLALGAMGHGAQDYLFRETINSEVMARSIRYAIERKKLIQEQVSIKEDLEHTKCRLEAILQQIPVGITIIEPSKGEIVFQNDEVVKLFRHGQAPPECIGEHHKGPSFDIDGGPVKAGEHIIGRSLSEGVTIKDHVERTLRGDGTFGYLSTTSAPVRDRGGRIIAAIALSIDVTEQMMVEQALKESEEKYHELFNNIKEGVSLRRFIFDEQGEIVDAIMIDANPAAFSIYGASSIDELKGRRYSEMASPAMSAQALDVVRRMRATGGSITEEEHYDANGRDYLVTVTPLGKDLVITTSFDITDRKRVEERNRLQASLLDQVSSAIAFVDNDYVVTYWNKRAEELYQWTAEETVGKRIFDFTTPLVPTDQAQKIVEEIRNTGYWEGEIPIRRKDGSVFDANISGSQIKDERGNPIGLVGIGRDMTGRKKIEEDLKRSNAELQQFAYIASHDLQEPLRMVTSYLSLLNKRYGNVLNEQAKGYISYAVDGAFRMRELINDLLEFSRIDTQGKPFLTVDLNLVVRQVIDSLQLVSTETEAVLTIGPLPTVWGDPTQLSQVLQNLISNAIKFHGPEPPRIEVTAREVAREWTLMVKDNGIGIGPKDIDRLFQMFQRLHTRAEYDGTGIGLAIAKKIVERHGGRIWVESDGKNGSTFLFTIPKSGL